MAALSEARKALTAGVGLLADLIASGTLHGTALQWAHVALTVATLTGVYVVPNKPAYQAKHSTTNPYTHGV